MLTAIFKLQLLMFVEDLRSERQLMRVVADRLSLRWYVGYDLFEFLPDHSSLTRIRERYGLRVVERTFSWLGQNRRMSKDYERLAETSEAFVYVAMTRLMVRRLAC